MRNFFKNTFGTETKITTNRQIAEILDTDEDKTIHQYKRYLHYINKVKKEIIQKSADLVRSRRQLQLR
jgi:hypothetical protein